MANFKKSLGLGIILSIITIILIFLFSIYKEGSKVLEIKLDYRFLLIVFFIIILIQLIESLKIKIILDEFNYKISFLKIVYIQFVSLFFATITPFGSGGFASKVYFFSKRKNFDIGTISGAITILYLINMFFSIFISIILIFFMKVRFDQFDFSKRVIYYVVLFILLLLLLIFFIMIYPNYIKSVALKILNLFKNLSEDKKEKIVSIIDKNYIKFRESIKKVRFFKFKIFTLFLLTLLYWMALLSISPLLLLSIKEQNQILNSIVLQFIYHFFVGWAITPGGSGISEVIFTFLFSTILNFSKLPTLIFLFRFFTFYLYIIFGGILSIKEIKELGDIKKIYEYG